MARQRMIEQACGIPDALPKSCEKTKDEQTTQKPHPVLIPHLWNHIQNTFFPHPIIFYNHPLPPSARPSQPHDTVLKKFHYLIVNQGFFNLA
jgi:hypothetical protein